MPSNRSFELCCVLALALCGCNLEVDSVDESDGTDSELRVELDVTGWVVAGESLTGVVRVTGGDARSRTLALDDAPDGMVLDPVTDVLRWNPRLDQTGSHDITVRAVDALGLATETATITVIAAHRLASDRIGPAGGVLEVTDPSSPLRGTRLEIPPGAIAVATEISVAVLAADPPDAGRGAAGPIVQLLPAGLQLAAPARLSMPDRVSPGSTRERLGVEEFVPRTALDHGADLWLPVVPAIAGVETPGALTVEISQLGTLQAAAADPYKIHTTEHFFVVWYTSGPFVPPATFPVAGTDPNVPDMVEFLAAKMEESYRKLSAAPLGLRLKAQNETVLRGVDGKSRTLVTVYDRASMGGNTGVALVYDKIFIDRNLSPLSLPNTAAHELAHQAQFRAWINPPATASQALHDYIATYLFSDFWREKPLIEAAAVDLAYQVFPAILQSGFVRHNLLFDLPMSIDSGYPGFPVFTFFRTRRQLNLAQLMARDAVPLFQYGFNASVPTGEYLHYLVAALSSSVHDVGRAWTEFAFAYQYSRSNTWIDRIKAFMPGEPPMVAIYRARPDPASRMTGQERRDSPRSLGQLRKPPVKTMALEWGRVSSYATDFYSIFCPTPGQWVEPDRQCVGSTAVANIGDWDVVVSVHLGQGIRGALYRMPYENSSGPEAEPTLLREFVGPIDEEFSVPLRDFAAGVARTQNFMRADAMALSFAHVPDIAASRTAIATGSVRVYLRDGFLSVAVSSTSSVTYNNAGRSCAIGSDHIAYCWGLARARTRVIDIESGQQLSLTEQPDFSGSGGTSGEVCSTWTTNWGGPDPWTFIWKSIDEVVCNRSPTPVSTSLRFDSIALGRNHTCAVATSGDAYCWGWNNTGAIGDGTTTTNYDGRNTPTKVLGGLRFASIGVGATHSCALTTEGVPYCWGSNWYKQLGVPTGTGSLRPIAVVIGGRFVAIAVGDVTSCALTADGDVFCWGGSFRTPVEGLLPHEIGGGTRWRQVTVGYSGACLLSDAGSIWCTRPGSETLAKVEGAPAFTSMSSGFTDTVCGITSDKRAYCWGHGYAGQLGNGSYANSTAPSLVAGGLPLTSISMGAEHACGLTTGGHVYCWGFNGAGGLCHLEGPWGGPHTQVCTGDNGLGVLGGSGAGTCPTSVCPMNNGHEWYPGTYVGCSCSPTPILAGSL